MQEPQETLVWSHGLNNLLKEGMATYSSVLARKIPWTEDTGRLQSRGSQRVRHNWATNTFTWSSNPTSGWITEGNENRILKRYMHPHVCAVLSHFSRVWFFATPWTVACQAPLSVGILQARVLECVAMPSSRRYSQPRDRAQGLNPGLPHCEQILYHLSHQGSPPPSLLQHYSQ